MEQPLAITKPFAAISQNKFLHDRSAEQTFQILIDAIRMRQEDMHNLEGVDIDETVYAGAASSEGALREFLRKAALVSDFLPSWWTDATTEASVQFGLSDTKYSLRRTQTKSEIIATWEDDRMPMKLRMFAEKIYGSAPGATRGDAMLAMMASSEGGEGPTVSTMGFDISSMFSGNARG